MEASTPSEALNLVENVREISAIVSDIVMPGESNGYATAQLLRRVRPDLSILLVTGLPRGDALLQQAQADFDLIRMPFDQHGFQRAGKAVMARPLATNAGRI